MYKLSDYLYRGGTFINNKMFPRKKMLSSVFFYTTNRCNSKCKHCFIWEQKSKKELCLEKIKEVMNSSCITKHTGVGLEGGEIMLHSEIFDILQWFSDNHPKYDLLTNAVAIKKVIEVVNKYTPKHLYISLDGDKEDYKSMRGVDNYDNVIKTVESLHKVVPISLMFTLTPYNNIESLKHVISVCKKYDVDLRIGIYNNIDFFNTKENAHNDFDVKYKNLVDMLPSEVHDFKENFDFLALYDEWKNGNLNLTCNSLSDSLVILPDGNIPLCQNLGIYLGNIYENTLDEIVNSQRTIELHKHYKNNCNKCWINFHRKFDIILYRNMEKLFPKPVIEFLFNSYKWEESTKTSYKKLLNRKLVG